MKQIIAASVEQIIFFDSEQNADAFCEESKKKDSQFELLDWDDTPDENYPNGYTIRIRKSYNKNKMLVSSMGIDNDPSI